MAYSSDLSDAEWEIVEPLLLELPPKKKKTRPPKWTNRQMASYINSKMVVIGATYLETYPLIQLFNGTINNGEPLAY